MDVRFDQSTENVVHITHQRNSRSKDLTDLSGIDVDMNDRKFLFQIFGSGNGTVCHTGTNDDQKVTVGYGIIGIGLAVVSQHSVIHGMSLRHHTDSHHGMDQRDLILFAEFTDRGLPVAEDNSAASTDQRTFRAVDGRDDLCHLLRIAFCIGLVSPDIHGIRILELLGQLLHLHVHRDINKDRSLTSGIGDKECFLEDSGNIINILDKVTVFYKGLGRSAHISFLKHIPPQQFTVHLSGDDNNGDTVGICGCKRSNDVRCSRTGRCNTNRRLSGYAGISAGRMTGCLFLSCQYMFDAGIVHRIIKRSNGNSGITEDQFNPFCFQTFDHGLCTIHVSITHLIKLFQNKLRVLHITII